MNAGWEWVAAGYGVTALVWALYAWWSRTPRGYR